MADTAVLTDRKYERLLEDLSALMQEGKKRAAAAAGRVLVETYWQIGKRIDGESLTDNAHYGESIVADLAEDLAVDEDSLRRSILFFRTYKKAAPRSGFLTWSHYKALIGVRSAAARRFYETEAAREEWTKDRLLQAIRSDLWKTSKGKKVKARRIRRPTEPTYLYKAKVERVIDGDTLLLNIDLGFQVVKIQRVRLTQVDAPPLDTERGYAAFEYVRDRLARVPSVVVRTKKVDLHGRYLGDIFYSFEETRTGKIFMNGRYLNQELLAEGLAKVF